jgi:hypothetical protein
MLLGSLSEALNATSYPVNLILGNKVLRLKENWALPCTPEVSVIEVSI